MGEVVNLNKARKKHNRADARRQAQENRIRHGRSRAEKIKDREEAHRSERSLEGKRLDQD